jgi:hypothetical protein
MGFIINPYRFSSSCPPFNPISIGDLKIWLDASDSSTITKDGSNRVSQWNDKSGNSYNQSQSTGGVQPLWIAADKNGLDVIDFVDERVMQQSSGFSSVSQPITIFAAAVMPKVNSAPITYALYDGITVSNRISFQGASESIAYYMFTNPSASYWETSNATDTEVWSEVVNEFNGASSEVFMGGVSIGTGNSGSGVLTGLTMCAQFNSDNEGEMKVGEILVYTKLVSDADRLSIRDYLICKWGL